MEDEAVVEEGGRAMPSSAKEPHRARREAGPATAPPNAAKSPSRPQNGTNVHSAQGTTAKAAKGKSPRLLALIATPSAPAQTAHQSALIPRLNRQLLALCVAVRTHGWYAMALGQAAMRWMKTRDLLPRKRRPYCSESSAPMVRCSRVARGATHRRVTDGRQADPAGTPRGRNGEGRRAPYMSLPQPCSLGQKHSCRVEVMISDASGSLDLDTDAWLWRIPDGRHYQVACFHCMSVRNPGSLLVGGTPGPLRACIT